MSGDEWIIVPNWDKFQNYTERSPVWIKVYLELRDKPEWEALNYTKRGLLVSIWMAYAHSKGQLQCKSLAQKTGLTTRSAHLASLNHAGLIQLSASKPALYTRSREVREEKEKKKPDASQKQETPKPKTNCPHCSVPLAGPRMLAEHLYLTHDGPDPPHWLEVETKADLG